LCAYGFVDDSGWEKMLGGLGAGGGDEQPDHLRHRVRTAQLSFIPANLFCMVLYAINRRTWRKAEIS
jgi:hypothetical protein